MITIEQAGRLRKAGVLWTPSAGDRFVVPDRDLDDDVFVLSNMTIEVHRVPEGRVIGFNGTTEWALDDLDKDEAVWLAREDQLRDLLGTAFLALTRAADGDHVVTTVDGGFRADTAAEAYGYALLHLLGGADDYPGRHV